MALFTFTGIILREEPGYSSLCPEDVASMGATPNEARVMLLEAATLHLEGALRGDRETQRWERGTVNCTKKHTLKAKLYFFYNKKRAKCEKKHSLGDSCTFFMTLNEHTCKKTAPRSLFPDPLLTAKYRHH